MSELLLKQIEFARKMPKLVDKAFILGYNVTIGDVYRDPRCNYGHKNSLHRKRLAIDLNLFRHGVYLIDGAAHNELHDFWDTLNGSGRIITDLNHYSLPYDGMT